MAEGMMRKVASRIVGKKGKKSNVGPARSMPKKKAPTRTKTSGTMGMGMKSKKSKRVRGAGRG